MRVKLLTQHYLEFLSLKGGCTSLSELHLSKCHIDGNHMSRLIFKKNILKKNLQTTTRYVSHMTSSSPKGNGSSMQHICGKLFDNVRPFFTNFLELRPEVKVTVTQKRYATLHNTKMYPHTKFGFPQRSNNIGDMLWK